MKYHIIHYFFVLCGILLIGTTADAQSTKWFKKARKAQLNIVTYGADGNILGSTNGFFIDTDGTALSDYSSFKGAARAVAIDEDGKEWPVRCIAGASALYDVVKLRIDIKKATPLTVATINSAKGLPAYVMPYLSSKASVPTITQIKKIETFNERFAYYTIPVEVTEKAMSCPVMNNDGEVIGLLQLAAGEDKGKCFAISADYARSLTTTAMSATQDDYRDILIRKELPADAEQANSFIYLIGTRDTAVYLAYVDDFISNFPKQENGYTMKAEMLAAKGDINAAEETWEAGLKAVEKKDEILYSRARSIYAKVQAGGELPESWTLDRAVEDIDAAYAQAPEAVYKTLKAHILYGQKRYADACQLFLDVNKSNLRAASNYLYAAQCQQMLGDTAAVLALQDSAVACYTKPYVADAAPALLMRAQTLLSMNKFREAVIDLNDYEHLMSNSLNANFYYQREQAEMRCRMYPQALSDIERAAKMQPEEPLFQAELAAVNYRFSQFEEAAAAARAAIALDNEFADAYRILGVTLRQQGKEKEAKEALQRAAELGDETAKNLLNAN